MAMAARRRRSPWLLGLGTAIGMVALFAGFAGWTRGSLEPRTLPWSNEQVAAALKAREARFDDGPAPVVNLDIPEADYRRAAAWRRDHPAADARALAHAVAEGAVPAWYPRGEADTLTPLVADGTLPPVAERVGDEPVVMRGVDGVGRYGGTWMRVASSIADAGNISQRLGNPSFFRFSPRGEPLVPHLARRLDVSDDGRVYTLHLRRGLRWSDGASFTSDDYLFWWRHVVHEPALVGRTPGVPAYLTVKGVAAEVDAPDEYTLRFAFTDRYPLFPYQLARTQPPCLPAHYLRAYHPVLGDPAFLDERMRHWGLASRRALWGVVTEWKNPELPRLSPWVLRRPVSVPPVVFFRNPFYFAVDESGNQLPYLDRVQVEVAAQRMIPLALAGGVATMQMRHLRFDNHTEVATRKQLAKQRLLYWYPASRAEWLVNPNLNRRVADGDSATAWKARLLADRRFRQALSVAINRADIVSAMYAGMTVPAQISPGPQSPYHHPGLQNAWIRHDPGRANALLDECWRAAGADPDARDAEGFRVVPGGGRLTFFLDYSDMTGEGPAPFVVDDWAAVGLRTIPRLRTRSLFYAEKNALDFDLNAFWGESEHDTRLYARSFIAFDTESSFAPGWGRWRLLGGLYGHPRATQPRNAVPVPEGHDMLRAMRLYEEAADAPTPEAARPAIKAMLDIAADNVWTLGIAEAPPQLLVVDDNLRNVPENALYGYYYYTPTNTGPETYYFGHPVMSPGAAADVSEAVRRAVPLPGRAGPGAGSAWRGVVTALVWSVPLLLVALLCLRHPFVLRRLALMVPTLFLVSVCVFVIIQLPPGDFLDAKMVELEQSGSDPRFVEEQIAFLKNLFHYDDPAWKRYLRWVGAYWFVTFDAADTGLLQGNLGRSMETQQFVNDMVGDTVGLTVAVSLATILFTWIVALPIGIYSAVRQHSAADYLITFVGFLGMCVPPFLLALVLMVLANVTGLFSPEFAAQPEWDWPKTVDFLKHVWIPVLVMGAGGTAGMIRVMRANLLDELRKPYVTTARAKGMRPLRLLVKYPVRLALNPFVSGLGGLFPQIVSGGTIVAMVLSLPMVGPMMLNALFAQDMNFAGSMLVVLSLLGIVGTLVSDLLLLWVDPRIRFEGGRS